MDRQRLRLVDSWVIGILLAVEVVGLIRAASIYAVGPEAPSTIVAVNLVLGTVSLAAALWIYFRLWRLAGSGPGSGVLLACFVCQALKLPPSYAQYTGLLRIAPAYLATANAIFIGSLVTLTPLASATAVLLAIGLLKSRLVPAWVGWLAALVAIVVTVSSATASWLPLVFHVVRAPGTVDFVTSQVAKPMGMVLDAALTAALGATLFWKGPREEVPVAAQVGT
jgi:hypothetical protein